MTNKPTRPRTITQLKKQWLEQVESFARDVCEIANQDPGKIDKTLQRLTATLPESPRSAGKQPIVPAEVQQQLLREIANTIRGSLHRQRVAFLGPLHSYSHLATLRHFGSSAELLPVRTIGAVFDEVTSGNADAGLVPIENSTDGRIVDTIGRLAHSPVKICGELPLRIHHNLLGIGTRDQITEVCSKPQALSQCREWLTNHLSTAKLTPTSSTTAAAERAAQDPTIAAVASRQAATQYGLKLLAEHIEDNPDNVTRFAVIGKDPAARTGNDKSSLLFELPHQPGALADAMAVFKRGKLNLTWIESFPKPGSPNEYLFFVEFEGHQRDLRARRALALLDKKTVRLEVLGSYPQASPVE